MRSTGNGNYYPHSNKIDDKTGENPKESEKEEVKKKKQQLDNERKSTHNKVHILPLLSWLLLVVVVSKYSHRQTHTHTHTLNRKHTLLFLFIYVFTWLTFRVSIIVYFIDSFVHIQCVFNQFKVNGTEKERKNSSHTHALRSSLPIQPILSLPLSHSYETVNFRASFMNVFIFTLLFYLFIFYWNKWLTSFAFRKFQTNHCLVISI